MNHLRLGSAQKEFINEGYIPWLNIRIFWEENVTLRGKSQLPALPACKVFHPLYFDSETTS